MKKIFVKPVKGRVVPNIERGGMLADDGEVVTLSSYWERRLRDGDVTKEKQPKAKGAN